MTTDDKELDLKEQVQNNIKKLEEYKSSYEKKKNSYNKLLNSSLLSTNMEFYEIISDALDSINVEISKIDKTINSLEKIDLAKNKLTMRHEKKIEDINKEFINNYRLEKKIVYYLIKKYNVDVNEKIELDLSLNTEIEEESLVEESIDIEGNDTLIISEVLGKVILPLLHLA